MNKVLSKIDHVLVISKFYSPAFKIVTNSSYFKDVIGGKKVIKFDSEKINENELHVCAHRLFNHTRLNNTDHLK